MQLNRMVKILGLRIDPEMSLDGVYVGPSRIGVGPSGTVVGPSFGS